MTMQMARRRFAPLATTSVIAGCMLFSGMAAGQDQRSAKSATFHTTAGDFNCQLFPDQVPNAVANFAGLADGSKDWTDPETKEKKHGVPMYNGTIFHRVIPNFMIQGGDPLGTGS